MKKFFAFSAAALLCLSLSLVGCAPKAADKAAPADDAAAAAADAPAADAAAEAPAAE